MTLKLVELSRPRNASDVTDLLVLWQNPQTRRILPVGRFSFDGDTYRFDYVRGAANSGMRPLLGFPDFEHHYSSGQLPLLFAQRILDPQRPDLARVIDELGLSPDSLPWEQIVRTGGSRQGDTIQVMQLPFVDGETAHARFFINGIRHIPGRTLTINGHERTFTKAEQKAALSKVDVGSRFSLVHEDNNPADEDALLVTFEETPIGYVPQVISRDIRQLLDSCTVTCAKAGGDHVPLHMRLVVDFEAPAPNGFVFDRDRNWEPAPVE